MGSFSRKGNGFGSHLVVFEGYLTQCKSLTLYNLSSSAMLHGSNHHILCVWAKVEFGGLRSGIWFKPSQLEPFSPFSSFLFPSHLFYFLSLSFPPFSPSLSSSPAFSLLFHMYEPLNSSGTTWYWGLLLTTFTYSNALQSYLPGLIYFNLNLGEGEISLLGIK